MKNSTKRSILRWVHIIFTIPVLGYVYGPPEEVQEYAVATRYVFVPLLVLSGYWMYSGLIFAVIGVAIWIGAYHLSGYGAAVLSQVVLFIARKAWLVIRARSKDESKGAGTVLDENGPCPLESREGSEK